MKTEIQKTSDMYSNHPINYDQIINSLKEAGKDLCNITQDDLSLFDQDHYDGSRAIDVLIEKLKIKSTDKLIDLCCGLGGTSRYVADKCGTEVIGVDVTKNRINAAEKLTKIVNLQENVKFINADILNIPIDKATFDVAIGQEAFLHISDKSELFRETGRILKKGGRLGFTDVIALAGVPYKENENFFDSWSISNLLNADKYKKVLEKRGFKIVSIEDLSSFWSNILKKRYEMYLKLGGATSSKFGSVVEKKWAANYKYFVDMFQRNIFGGIRIVAVKNY